MCLIFDVFVCIFFFFFFFFNDTATTEIYTLSLHDALPIFGGLGHLGVQFAVKMGFRTVAIARGPDKAELALELGAHRYIDSKSEDAAKVLTELGGAKVILATVASGKAMTPLIDGLGVDGKLLVVGASQEPIEVTP